MCGHGLLQKFLVLINPAGGPGKAKQIYDAVVAPVLTQSDIAYDAIVTERQHHASEIVASAPLNAYDCIVAVGGDGLLSESACVEKSWVASSSSVGWKDRLMTAWLLVCSHTGHHAASGLGASDPAAARCTYLPSLSTLCQKSC